MKIAAALVVAGCVLVAGQRNERCSYTGSRMEGGAKVCAYSCPSGGTSIRIAPGKDCPLTIVRPVY
jgi:hypothetical protein